MIGEAIGGGLSALGQIWGAKMQADAMKDASEKMADAQQNVIDEQRQAYSDVAPMYAPYSQAGLAGLAGMQDDYSTQMGNFEYNKNVNDFLDPSMDFQQEQMRNALEQSAVSRGNLQSGGFAKALQDRSAQLAQTDYGNSYNRMAQDKQSTYQRFMDDFASRRANNQLRLGQMQNLATIGQNATTGMANLRTNNANQVSQGMQNLGTAQAQGAQAGGMVYGQALQNLTSPQNLMGAYNAYNSLNSPQSSNQQGIPQSMQQSASGGYNQLPQNQYNENALLPRRFDV